MTMETYNMLGSYLSYLTTKILSNPLYLLWDLFNPLTFGLIFLMLLLKIPRSLFFVVGLLISHTICVGISYLVFLPFIMKASYNFGFSLIGPAVFCVVCAYFCIKYFVNYSAASQNPATRHDTIRILLFGVFYTLCNITSVFQDLATATAFANSAAFIDVLQGYYIAFYINLIFIIIPLIVAAIIYLVIKILPFKNATRIAFLVLGICFIIYVPANILLYFAFSV